jgi:U4/U6 small nuclear ribonucleoprotein PRP3
MEIRHSHHRGGGDEGGDKRDGKDNGKGHGKDESVGGGVEEPVKKKTRRSRFDGLGAGSGAGTGSETAASSSSAAGAAADAGDAATLAAMRAAEIARSIAAAGGTGISGQSASLSSSDLQMSLKAAELQAAIAAQLASASSLLNQVQATTASAAGAGGTRKAAYRTLRLDEQGREIDESGRLVTQDFSQIRTLAANLAVNQAQKKKVNPYLAHKIGPSQQGGPVPPASLPYLPPGVVAEVLSEEADGKKYDAFDERVAVANRDRRGKKALSFVEPGKYVAEAETLRVKEERKIIAGYSSGRKAPEVIFNRAFNCFLYESYVMNIDVVQLVSDLATSEPAPAASAEALSSSSAPVSLPPPHDGGVVPSMEWWDEAFLPKQQREERKRSRAAADKDDYSLVAITYVKSFQYVQHPVAVKALGGEKPDQPLPMYLTKKERKRIRKQARAARETEKRDKMMMGKHICAPVCVLPRGHLGLAYYTGLIPAAEPKFTLSNFMKVLGDQAVADPSKVELRVLQQMQQRQMNHEMRNQAAKLTPQERAAKRVKKMQEDTSRQVHVAVFRVWNLTSPKHRFKLDVTAQQSFLTGMVLLNQETFGPDNAHSCNIVIVEGGPKGIRKFVKLMTKRFVLSEIFENVSSINASVVLQNQME